MISFSTGYLETSVNDLYILCIHVMGTSGRIWVAGSCTVPCVGGDRAGDSWVQPAQKWAALTHHAPILQPVRATYGSVSSGRFKKGW